MPSASDDPGLLEWQTARTVLNQYDSRLNDLRKYGFGLITGLLSVSALFANVQPEWKLAALLATLCLIVSLDLVDRNYRAIQLAATIDAQILERGSKMNLTQTISRMYDQAHVKFYFEMVYIVFSLVALLLGLFFLAGQAGPYHLLLFATYAAFWFLLAWVLLYDVQRNYAWGVVIFALILASLVFGIITCYSITDLANLATELFSVKPIHYHLTLFVGATIAIGFILWVEKAVDTRPWVDWRIAKYEYEKGENVLVMLSNVGPQDFELKGEPMTVHKEEDGLQNPMSFSERPLSKPIKIRGSKDNWKTNWSDQRWQFSTNKLEPGLYRVVYNGPIYRHRWGLWGYSLLDPNEKIFQPEQECTTRTGKVSEFLSLIRSREERKKISARKAMKGYDKWKVAQRFLVREKEAQKAVQTIASSQRSRKTKGHQRLH